ncbi:LOW QUALITY PROTEIN: acyl-CoA wax alcohol acyltransferase 2 [Trichechus inunguis]
MLLPSKKDFKTALQIFAIFQWALGAFLTAITVIFGNLYLVVFTSYWPITVLILTWLAFDWKTPERGGCRLTCVRHWCLWKQYYDYFPLKLRMTHDISPNHEYILVCYPHGIKSHSYFAHFATEITGFSKIFPGLTLYMLTLGAFFWLPFLRDYTISTGACSVSHSSMDFLLTHRGTSKMFIVVPGGLVECRYSQPGSTILVLKNQSGFVCMALRHGQPGMDLYDQLIFTPEGFVNCFHSMAHIYPCAFYGHGYTKNSRGLLPCAQPVTTIVGKPLPLPKIENPSQKTMVKYHALYIDAIHNTLFDHKTMFGLSETQELVMV